MSTIESDASAAAEERWPSDVQWSNTSKAERAGFIAGYLAASRREPSEAHDRDRMGICRRCGQGVTAAQIIDGEQSCRAPEPEPSDTDEREVALIRWLVETLHYPSDVTFAKTPPVSLDALADYWNEHDEWGVTPQEARAMIRDQAVWEEVIPDGE